MLKFSGCSCLNSGRKGCSHGCPAKGDRRFLPASSKAPGEQRHAPFRVTYQTVFPCGSLLEPLVFSGPGRCRPGLPGPRLPIGGVRVKPTLRQTYSWPEPRVQFAFKDSMIHIICNSHYVSHFAAFFIDTGAKISVVESCLWLATSALGGRQSL